MADLYPGAPIDSRDLREAGLDVVPSATGEVLGAVAEGAFANMPTARVLDLEARGARDTGYSFAAGVPVQIGEPRPLLSPEDANKEFKLPGMVPFSAPVSRETAQDIYDAHQRRLARENAIERRAGGIATGMAARFGTELIVGLLDPLNVASAFIPVVPEAKIAAALAGASGAFGRAGVRAGVGAVEGAAGALALEPLNYALDRANQNDWTMGNAAMNVALGAVMGGALHTGVGAVRDWRAGPSERIIADQLAAVSPETREAAARGALAHIVEGRAVNVADAIDAAEAMRAARELQTWAERTRRLSDETDATIAETTPGQIPDWQPIAARAQDTIASLHAEAAALRAEIHNINTKLQRPEITYHATNADEFDQFDFSRLGENTKKNATSDALYETSRLGVWFSSNPDVGTRMAADRTIPAILSINNARKFRSLDTLTKAVERAGNADKLRASLQKQGYDGIALLVDEEMGGRSYVAFRPDQINRLEIERTLQEQRGLQSALSRVEQRAHNAKNAASATDEMAALAARRREQDAAETDRGWSRREALIASKAEVIQALTERTLRRYAGELGVDAGDTARSALRILTSQDPNAEALAVLAEMRRGAPRRAGVPTPDDMKAQQAIDAAMSRLYGEADRISMSAAREGPPDPITAQAVARATELNATAPKFTGEIAQDMAEVDKLIARHENRLRVDADNPEIAREIEAANRVLEEGEVEAKSYEAAAGIVCRMAERS